MKPWTAILMAASAALWGGSPAGAGQTTLGTSQEAAPWLSLPVNARAAGMGDACGALSGDVEAIGLNPAGLSGIASPEVLFMHNAWFQDLSAERLVAGGPSPWDKGSVGFSLDYLNFGSADAFSIGPGNTLVSNGTLVPDAFNVSLTYARPLSDIFLVGISGRYVEQNLPGVSTSALGADLGLLAKDLLPHFSAGLALLDLGTVMNGFTLPTELNADAAYQSEVFNGGHSFNLVLNAGVPLSQDRALGMGMGVEYWYQKTLALRIGEVISDDRAPASETLDGANNGLTLGVGLDLGKVRLDYAFESSGVLGNSNLFSLLARL